MRYITYGKLMKPVQSIAWYLIKFDLLVKKLIVECLFVSKQLL